MSETIYCFKITFLVLKATFSSKIDLFKIKLSQNAFKKKNDYESDLGSNKH